MQSPIGREGFSMKNLYLLAFFILFIGCASDSKKTEVLETKLQQGQAIGKHEKIGTNAAGEVVYQRKQNLINELIRLEDEVGHLQDRVYGTPEYQSKGLYGKAQQCRKQKALKTGELSYIPEKSPVIEEDQVKIGQDAQTQKLIALSEEGLEKRLARFKDYKKTLFGREEQLEQYIEKCEIDSR
jgi:hypothetical protein